MIEEAGVITGQYKLAAEIKASVGVHFNKIFCRLRQACHVAIQQDLIKRGMKAPNFRAGRYVYAGKHSIAMYRAGTDKRLDDKHTTSSSGSVATVSVDEINSKPVG
jgi:hypothetical protein